MDFLSEMLRKWLLGCMGKLFYKKVRGRPLIIISNLFIGVGQLKEDDWEGELVNSVIQKLEAALDKEAAEWENRQNSPLRVNQTTAPENEQDRRCSFLLYYLENGVQPWNSPFDHKKQMRDELLKADRKSTRLNSSH